MFVYILPTTRPVAFADHLIASDLTLELTQLTEKRSRVQHVLQLVKSEKTTNLSTEAARGTADDGQADTEAPFHLSQKDWLKVVQAAEEYTPWICALDRCLKTDDVLLAQGELVFTWKETLAASANKIPLPGVQCELFNVLVMNAKATCNLSAALVSSVGRYEYTQAATLSDEERKRKEERLKFGADLLCRAAGMFEFAANDVMRDWENAVGAQRLSQLGRGVDCTREMCFAMSRLAQAEAECLAIRKLLSPTTCLQHATRTTSPPLPSGHPSPSLLSKLYLNVTALFEAALSLAQTASEAVGVRLDAPSAASANAAEEAKRLNASSLKARLTFKSSNKMKLLEETTRTGKLSRSLAKYLTKSALAGQARAYLWLAVDKGERGQYGEAISFLRAAQEEVEGLTSSSATKKLGIQSRDDRKRDEKRMFAQEYEEISTLTKAWLQSYVQLNDTVGFQPIPPASQLSSQIPAGRGALTVKPFKLPVPAFGPGSLGFESDGMKRWRGMGEDNSLQHPATVHDSGIMQSGSAGGTRGGGGEEEYAGKGAYY